MPDISKLKFDDSKIKYIKVLNFVDDTKLFIKKINVKNEVAK